MILFVFEGENREPTLFKTLEYLYFSKNKQIRICSYKNNIYDLYKRMNETDEPEDIVSILKNKLVADKDNPLKEIRRRSDFSQIYLFLIMTATTIKIRIFQILRFRKCLISLMMSLLTMENYLSIILW